MAGISIPPPEGDRPDTKHGHRLLWRKSSFVCIEQSAICGGRRRRGRAAC